MAKIVIRPGQHGSIEFLVQSTGSDSARHTVERRFRRARDFRWLPASPFVYDEVKGCIVAGMRGNRLIERMIAKLRLEKEVRKLTEGSYLIRKFIHGRRVSLLVLGGDLSGLHYALSDVARHLQLADGGLEYSGGDKLEVPAFAYRGFWDTDTRMLWNQDVEFPVRHCCLLDYPGDAATYVDNMKRAIDGMVDFRRNVLTIWGFVRDEHGGIEAAQEICRYASERGIDVAPGIGTHFYGGPYYRGDHPFNLDTYMRTHREHTTTCRFGVLRPCPTDPKNIEWLLDGVHWLFETFDIRGVNLENGDYFACPCPRCRKALKALKSRNPEFIQAQYLSYGPVLRELQSIKQSRWNVYATYTGFSPLYEQEMDPLDTQYDPDSKRREEVMMQRRNMPDKTLKGPMRLAGEFGESAIAQWNIAPQVRGRIPLKAFLDDGNPDVVYEGPLWPRDLRSPAPRNIYYYTATNAHGSFSLSALKELAVRVAEGGYEGVIDYGELSPREVAAELNYLAMSHFAYRPYGTLRDFAREQLAHRVGGAKLAQEYVELLCRKDSGELTQADRDRIWWRTHQFEEAMIHLNATTEHPSDYSVDHFQNWYPFKYWRWLGR